MFCVTVPGLNDADVAPGIIVQCGSRPAPICAVVLVGGEQEVVLLSQTISRLPVPPDGETQLPIAGAGPEVGQCWTAPLQLVPKPIVPPLVTLSQTCTGVPAQAQPSAVTTSLVVFGLPSLQGVPGVAGNAGLFGWQSWLLQMPSPSESPPWLAQGSLPVTVTVACFSQIC